MTNNVIPDDIKMTPWLEQYKAFKEDYPDALLLFRMGDFYEMFFDDARNAAATLNIALTARDPEKKIPMAGIPHHALNSYLASVSRSASPKLAQSSSAKSSAWLPRAHTFLKTQLGTPHTSPPSGPSRDASQCRCSRSTQDASRQVPSANVMRLPCCPRSRQARYCTPPH